ncbi:hypothetical protein EW145_g3464 [Phellinidium pouzarii]|uniref:Transcription initiation factor IIF subunit beta n=1 Tax=Phellinidium pouzarii TaxID=167371 RepID=A0A4S4L7A9_9AGAM|nr:hypothetical protein EW145_g3464 [Phellinidium pouzarii]
MDESGTEDIKPHDLDVKEEETQPDPDEHLMMDQGSGRVWSVKVPKHLMEHWSTISKDNVHLATMRVYNKDPRTGKQRMMLLVPSTPLDPNDPASSQPPPLLPGTYDEYELDMLNDTVENQIVVAEREKAPGSRARTTILTGRVKHECNMRPILTDAYRRRMKKRTVAANKPVRTVKIMDDAEAGGVGRVSMLASGAGPSSAGFANLVKTKPKPAKGTFERFARMPRNQLLDMLFALYRERSHWSAKDLRSRTEQPEAYLKEVLGEIADLHRSGEFNGLYELKSNFKDSVKSEAGEYLGAAGALMQATKTEPDVDLGNDDDDSDDDDMEEIS